MSQAAYVQNTGLLRTSASALWRRLRSLLEERGLDPAATVLVNLFPDGGDHEFGQCMDEDGRVYSFDLVYDRQMPKAEGRAVLRNWTDVTDTWQHRSFADETANAFIWRPPSRRTALPA